MNLDEVVGKLDQAITDLAEREEEVLHALEMVQSIETKVRERHEEICHDLATGLSVIEEVSQHIVQLLQNCHSTVTQCVGRAEQEIHQGLTHVGSDVKMAMAHGTEQAEKTLRALSESVDQVDAFSDRFHKDIEERIGKLVKPLQEIAQLAEPLRPILSELEKIM